MIKGVHHIAYITRDLDGLAKYFQEVLGFEFVKRMHYEPWDLDIILMKTGEQYVEVIKPLKPGSPSYRFLEKHGEGLYHVAYLSTDIEKDMEELKSKGIKFLEEKPAQGVAWLIATAINDEGDISFQIAQNKD